MLETFLEILLDAGKDTLKLLPFLFATYLLMEFIEHKSSEKTEHFLTRGGKFGPVFGALLGIVPQCGFSASAASLYSGRIISLGTLVAIFLSTSDEMLPVLLSERIEISRIVEIIVIKIVVAIILGVSIDLVVKKKSVSISSLCDDENCNCEECSIFKSALIHSVQIAFFIFVISIGLNSVFHSIGEDKLGSLFTSTPILGCMASAFVGLIPNCAASVVITELFINGVISTGAMLSGLLTGCGIGLLVLFRTNKKNVLENISITVLMYILGVVIGSIVDLLGIAI